MTAKIFDKDLFQNSASRFLTTFKPIYDLVLAKYQVRVFLVPRSSLSVAHHFNPRSTQRPILHVIRFAPPVVSPVDTDRPP